MKSFSEYLRDRPRWRIDGNLLLPLQNLGMPREHMPQISDVNHFLGWLTEEFGYKSSQSVRFLHELIPTQNQINLDKCKNYTGTKNPLISEDDYIVDGHHSAFSNIFKEEQESFPVTVVHAPVLDILKATFHYPAVFYKSINESKFS